MRILFTASEIYPFLKTGGLGDVAGALPAALAEQGADVRLMLPGYPAVLDNLEKAETVRRLPLFFGAENARILKGRLPGGLIAYALDIPGFYDRSGPYVDENGKDWTDNHLRFGALCRAAADAKNYSGWQPDILHGNDWHCGLIPAYARLAPGPRPATVLTIHNMAYQGIFPAHVLPEIGLSPCALSVPCAEYEGQIGFLKAGLYYADALTAVSPTYAREICETDHGCGLQSLVKMRASDLTGILNGIDLDVWNPAADPELVPYNAANLAAKKKNRAALLRDSGLGIADDKPVFGVASRLVDQKGLDLLLEAMPPLLKEGAGLVLIGSGDAALEDGYRRLAELWPQQVSVIIGYDEPHAHRIIGGADAMLVPSRFEPCGLVQMYALRYGTLPVVRRTGGLADTVDENTGFLFDEATAAGLGRALGQACETFRRPGDWQKMQKAAMQQDFSWAASARNYLRLYDAYKRSPAFKRAA